MVLMTRIIMLLTCCALLALAGCGGDDEADKAGTPAPATTDTATTGTTETDTATTGGSGGEEVEIKIENFAFSPRDATVKVGQTVKWKQEDQAPHDVDSQSGERIKSPVMQKGGEFEYTPKQAGKVSYICSIHPNMKATLTVVE
jgi:plastocyanin